MITQCYCINTKKGNFIYWHKADIKDIVCTSLCVGKLGSPNETVQVIKSQNKLSTIQLMLTYWQLSCQLNSCGCEG